MYSMKEACALTGMTYENLKFYCKEGLVPNVKRDSRNYRVFDDHDIKWIQSLGCHHSRQKRDPLPEKRSPADLHAAVAGSRGLYRLEAELL